MESQGIYSWSSKSGNSSTNFNDFADTVGRLYCMWDMRRISNGAFHASMRYQQVKDFAVCDNVIDAAKGSRDKILIARDGRDFFCIRYNLRGSFRLKQGHNENFLAPGDIAIWDSTRPLDMTLEDHAVQRDVLLPRWAALSLVPGIEDLCGSVVRGKSPLGRILYSHLQHLGDALPYIPEAARLELMHATVQLIGACFLPDEPSLRRITRRPALARVQEYVLTNLCDPSLSAASIAAELGFSTRYLHRLFEGFDFTIGDWIRRRRLLASHADLLRSGPNQETIAQIANKYGFSHQSHFARLFRLEFGMSPIQFRRQAGTNAVRSS